MKRISFQLIFFLASLLLPVFQLYAVPSVSSISGTVSDGASITISGNSFGSGPNLVLFDDFESGTPGSNIKTGNGSAAFGKWSGLGVTPPTYSNLNKVSGSKAMRTDLATHWLSYAEVLLPPQATEVFYSWWMMIPAGDNFPGQTDPDCINWKTVWLQGEGSVDDDLYPGMLGPGTSGSCPAELTFGMFCNGCPYTRYFDGFNIVKGQWTRVSIHVKGSSTNTGKVQIWELDKNLGVLERLNDIGVKNLNSGGIYERIDFNGYGRTTANSHPTFDDIYVAEGASAMARIEIGNKSTYASSTKLALATPTTWSAAQISATIRQGVFQSGESAFLFVIDANGAASAGHPLTISQTYGTSSAPNAPQNLKVEP